MSFFDELVVFSWLSFEGLGVCFPSCLVGSALPAFLDGVESPVSICHGKSAEPERPSSNTFLSSFSNVTLTDLADLVLLSAGSDLGATSSV